MILRCSLLFLGLIVAFIAIIIPYGRHNSVLVGNIPFWMVEQRITEENIPDLTKKVIIVTGANAGLGKSTVKHLAMNGAEVIMACRSHDKCHAAKKEIIDEVQQAKKEGKDISKFKDFNLVEMNLDLSCFKSIKKFADMFKEQFTRLDSLILNAGVMHTPFGLTKDGFETQFGINHMGHFYLTQLLLPLVEASEPSTIVSVSSVGHYGSYTEGVKLEIDKLNSEIDYNSILAYGQSKLANVLFAQELSERLRLKDKKVYVNAVHPGAVNTELLRHYPEILQNVAKYLFKKFPNKIAFESDKAALVEVYAAVSPEIFKKRMTGQYFVPIGHLAETSEQAKSLTLQKGLWKFSEEMVEKKTKK